MCRDLLEKDAIDERADDLVEAPQVYADNGAGNDHDCDALERLATAGPVDFLELRVGLADELPTRLRSGPTRLLLDGLLRRAHLRLTAATARRRAVAGCGARGSALSPRLAGHELPRLPVRCMPAAPAAVLPELDAVGRVSL